MLDEENYEIKLIRNRDIDEVVDFCMKNPYGAHYSRELIIRFLTELSSQEILRVEVWHQNDRVAVAVLLDTLDNLLSDACIELLGLIQSVSICAVINAIDKYFTQSELMNKNGAQICVSENENITSDFWTDRKYEYYFSTYSMVNQFEQKLSATHVDCEIRDADKSDADLVYNILVESFAKNPETNIPSLETWKNRFMAKSGSFFYIASFNDQCVAYLHLVENENRECEINTLGVLENFRNRGIAKALLKHALMIARNRGNEKCFLNVAIDNSKALGLYLNLGFTVVEKHNCYRKNLTMRKT